MKDSDKSKEQLIAKLEQLRQMHQSCEMKLQKVTQSEKMLQDIIDYNPLSIQIVDSQGRNIMTNASFTRLFGAEPGPDFCLFTDSQLMEAGLEYHIQWLKNGETVNFPDNLYNPHRLDPKYPDVDVYTNGVGFPVFGPDQLPECFVLIHQDVTERAKDHKQLVELNQQLKLITEINKNIRENERKTLANELHDEFGLPLSAIKLNLEVIKGNIRNKALVADIDRVIGIILDTDSTIKKILSDLRSVQLEELGLKTAVETFVAEFAKANRLTIYLNIDDDFDADPERSLVIYKILKGALSNVAQHAEATTVDIWLNRIDDHLELIVSDNGRGITPEQIASNLSFGVISMRERALSANGTFEICPGSNRGTTITVDLPVSNETV